MVALLKTTQIQEPSSATVNLTLSATGGVSVGNGTLASPSTLSLQTNGSTTGLYIDTSQNVGIGTSSPSTKFVVETAGFTSYNSASAPSPTVRIKTNGTSNSAYEALEIECRGTAGQSQSNYIVSVPEATDGNASLAFQTYGSYAAAERMRITSSGNVGIGTTSISPIGSGYTTLAIAGTNGGGISVNGSTAGVTGYFYIQNSNSALNIQNATATGVINLQTNGTTRATIDASGNVGIGTSSPSGKLDVNGNQIYIGPKTALSANGGQIFFRDDTGANRWVAGIPGSAAATQYFIYDYVASATRMLIDSSGNVGIGTSSPSSSYINKFLQVNDATSSGLVLSAARKYSIYSSSSSTLSFFDDTAGSARMIIDSSGNLLVGTTSLGTYTIRLSLSYNSGTTIWGVGPTSTSPTNFYVASSGTTGVYLNGTAATSWSSNSDINLKTDLKPIENAVEKVSTLRAVTGRYKTDQEGTSRAFLIAQDVQAVLPEAVAPTTMYDGTEALGLAYTETIPLLVAAIKELSAQVTAQAAEITALKAKVGA